VPALNDPSPIDDMGFCGMNFFSTPQYDNTRWLCQWITDGNYLFRRKFEPERLCRRQLTQEPRKSAIWLGVRSGESVRAKISTKK